MKKTFLFCLLLFVTVYVIGQSVNVDSLVNILETQKLTPKKQLDLYIEICDAYKKSSFEKHKLYSETGLALAEKEKDKKMIGYFCNRIGGLLMEQFPSDSSLMFLNRALVISQKTKDKQAEANASGNLGNWYHRNDKKKEALDFYLKSLNIYEKLGDNYRIVHTLLNISNFYISMGQNEQALSYIIRAQGYPETDNNPEMKEFLNFLLSGYYYKNHDFEKALENGLVTLDLCRKYNFTRHEIASIQILIDIYIGIEDFENAEKYALECLKITELSWDKKLFINSLNALAILYLNTNRLQEGRDFALKSWCMDSVSLQARSTAGILSHIYLLLDETENVLYYSRKADSIRSKFTELQFLESLSAMEIKYETEKKEMRIAALEKERHLYIGLGISVVVLAIVLGFLLFQSKRNARREKQLVATRSILDGEMQERTRLAQDLHDRLSGNLSAVKIELNKHADSLQDVRDQLDNCIRDIRDVVHDIMPPSLQYGLKVALENFAAQFPNVRFHFFGTEKRFDERIEYLAYCCASELVNNSVKHSGAKNINMQLIQDEKHVTLTVSDDGCGFNEKNKTDGIGLKNIKNRVASCNGKIDIDTSIGKGTETSIELRMEN